MATSLEQLNLEEGKSEALRSVFACIEQATAADGGPRYAPKVCRTLSRAIVCRTYGKMILELTYLLAAASAGGRRFEHLFWGIDRASTFAFKSAFADIVADDSLVRMKGNGIAVSDDGAGFLIAYSRMPVLSAMLEFLVTAIGYAEVDEATAAFNEMGISAEKVSATAGHLQRLVYAYLKDHLPPAQRQRRERDFLAFTAARAGNRTSLDSIDDPVVLAYWQENALDGRVEARTYRSVFETAKRLVGALEVAGARRAANLARVVGTDREAGEIDPDDVAEVAELISEDESSLARVLTSSGDSVKFVNRTEAEILSDIPSSPNVARRLPVSVLRNGVYGARQLQLSNAVRRNSSDMDALISPPEGDYYRDKLRHYEATLAALEKTAMAALWTLFTAGHEASCDLALALAPDLDWQALAYKGGSADGNIVSLVQREALRKFLNEKPDSEGDEIQALLADARVAFRSVNRLGFKGDPDEETVMIMAETVPALLALIADVRRFLEAEQSGRDWSALEASDGVEFSHMFKRLYVAETEVSHAG